MRWTVICGVPLGGGPVEEITLVVEEVEVAVAVTLRVLEAAASPIP